MAYQYVEDPSLPNAGSQYYWKVVTKEEIGSGGSSPEDGYVSITTVSKRVNLKHEVRYYIRVYKTVNNLPVKLKDNVVQVAIPQTWANTVTDGVKIGDIISIDDSTSPSLFGDKDLFYVGFQGKTGGFTFTPRFRVTLKPDTEENPTQSYKEIFPASGYDGIPRTITFTETDIDPEIPQNIKSDAAYNSLQGLITLNRCEEPNKWVALVVQEQSNQRFIYVKTYALDGTFITQEFIGKDAKPGGPGPDKIEHYEIGRERLLRLKAKDCFDGNVSVPDPGDLLPPDADKIRYNPPNHFVTRSVAHGERTRESFERNGIITNVVGAQEALSTRNRRLGKIYQSEDGAAALNKPAKGELKFWGFKFSYNPQSIQYSTAVDTSIDWMLNSKDPANLLGGNTQVSIQLYLNRIADMTELKKWNKAKASDYGTNYPRALRKEEIEGILYRGTEYDLEFLYRVLNGDPGKTALLEYDGKTSDFGYITGTPCWFHLHNNMRYYGSMANVSVNHVMFTQEMVPMLSTVDISFIRYPSLEFASPAQQREAILNAAKNLGGTGEEAKK